MKSIFISRENTVGRSAPTNIYEGKKKKAKSWTEQRETTEEDWELHLTGKTGVGQSPILENNSCWWGAIDVDNYDIDIDEISNRFANKPFFFCRTKSGGLHIYLFFSKTFSAPKVKVFLEELVLLMCLPPSFDKNGKKQKYEVFPKQTKVPKGENHGNWLNMPYFNCTDTTQYCIYNGVKLSLEQFIEKVNENKISSFKKILDTFNFSGAPPCLQDLLSCGVYSGSRDNFLLNSAIFFKQKFPDDWKEKLKNLNTKKIENPLSENEIEKIIKSSDKKDYSYTCAELKVYCQKDVCYNKREYGKAASNDLLGLIEGLTKIQTTPPVYRVEISGKEIELETEALLNYKIFKLRVFEVVDVMLPPLTNNSWEEILSTCIDDMKMIEAPEDATKKSTVESSIEDFFLQRSVKDNMDAIGVGNVCADTAQKIYFFRREHLIEYLGKAGFKVGSDKLFHLLESKGCKKPDKRPYVNNKQVRVWQLPFYPEHTFTEENQKPNRVDFNSILDKPKEEEY